MFYFPNHNLRIIKIKNSKLIKLCEISRSMKFLVVIIKEVRVDSLHPQLQKNMTIPLIDHHDDILEHLNDHSF